MGSGIPRILEYYGKDSFSFSDNFLRMTLIAKEAVTEVNKKAKEEGGVIGGAIDASEALTKRQREILKLIASNTTITYTEIAEALGVNGSAVGKHITTIKNKGFLVRQGDTSGYWEINLKTN